MKRKITSVILATTLSASMLTSAYASTLTDLNSKKNELEQEQRTSEGKINELQSKLDVVKAEIAELQKKLDAITNLIAKTDQEISNVQNKIAATDKSIEQTIKDIAAAEAELAHKKDILSRNLRLMYSKGDTSYMEYLFTSKDISDFLYRFDSLKDIAKANRDLYDSVRVILTTLAEKKSSLDQQRADQVVQKNKLVTLRSSQQQQKSDQLKIQADLHEKKESIEDHIADEKAALSMVQSQAAAMARKIAAERKRLEEEAKQNGTTPPPSKPVAAGNYAFPLPAGSWHQASPFGYRIHPVTGVKTFHSGTDLAASYGTPIYAINNGVVLYAGPAKGFGHWVVIDHGNGTYSVYGHMYGDQLYVSPGQTVSRGQKISAVGSDGTSTGNHLHFGICNEAFVYRDPSSILGL